MSLFPMYFDQRIRIGEVTVRRSWVTGRDADASLSRSSSHVHSGKEFFNFVCNDLYISWIHCLCWLLSRGAVSANLPFRNIILARSKLDWKYFHETLKPWPHCVSHGMLATPWASLSLSNLQQLISFTHMLFQFLILKRALTMLYLNVTSIEMLNLKYLICSIYKSGGEKKKVQISNRKR